MTVGGYPFAHVSITASVKPRVHSLTLFGKRRWYVRPPYFWAWTNATLGCNQSFRTWREAMDRALADDMQARPHIVNYGQAPR